MQINFRDCGDLVASRGRRVKPDRLYRSGRLSDLSTGAKEKLLALDFSLVADLRYPNERLARPSPWPDDYAGRLFMHHGQRTGVAPHLALMESGQYSEEDVRAFYLNYYAELPFQPLYQPLFAQVLRSLPETRGRFLFHCSAGKDRTGLLVALVLRALDVTAEGIIAIYLESRNAPGMDLLAEPLIRRLSAHIGLDAAQRLVSKYLDVDADYINASFAAIDARIGSLGAYFNAAGLTPSRREILQENLLEG